MSARWIRGIPVVLGLSMVAAMSVTEAAAQRRPVSADSSAFWPGLPANTPISTHAERIFDIGAGLSSSTVFDVALDPAGTPWIATEGGLYEFTGSQWRRDGSPIIGAQPWIRALLFTRDGSLWVASRQGIIRRGPDGRVQQFGEAEGVEGLRAFSLIETRAIDGQWRVVAGLYGGVVYFDGTRFVPLRNPEMPAPRGVMVAEAAGRDGVPELWMADAVSGVARYRAGRWRTFGVADGLDIGGAQYLLGAAVPGVAPLLVAGNRGVFALKRGPDGIEAFERLPGSPQRATRVAVVPWSATQVEIWVGTQTGELARWFNGSWSPIESRVGERGGSYLVLRAMPQHGPGAVVYASKRSGHLVRFSVGVAATVGLGALPTGALYVERDANGRDVVWTTGIERIIRQMTGDGAVRNFALPMPASPVERTLVFPMDIGRHSIAPPRPAGRPATRDSGVIIAVEGGRPWYQRGGTFVPMQEGLGGARVQRLLRVTTPDGLDALLAPTSAGLFRWSGTAWRRYVWPDRRVPANMQVRAVLPYRDAGAPHLLLGTNRGIFRLGARALIADSLAQIESPAGAARVQQLCAISVDGVTRNFALVLDEGIFWRSAESTLWQRLPARLARTTPLATAVGMACLSRGRLAVATPTGVTLFTVASTDTTAWMAASNFSDADGLPASLITGVSPSPSSPLLWIGTDAGVGAVHLANAATRAPSALRVRVTSQQTGAAVPDGATLEPGDDDVQIDAALLTFHREEATRYRVRLRADRWGDRPARDLEREDGPVDDREWLPSSTRNFLDLAPGSYALSVWAYDWTGREYGPIEQRFIIAAPVWRRWPALVLYVVVASLLGGLAVRWRRRTLADAERARRETERQVAAERAHYEEQIREAQKLESLGTLAGGVAHDFNNLLGVIRGNAELARSAVRKGRTGEDQLGAILDASDRARDIVRQILTFSRRSTPTRDFVNLPLLVRDLQPLLRRMVPRSVQLAFEGLDGVYVIRGDATQLQQLLLNLVSNAEHAIRGRERQVVTIALGARVVSADAPAPTGEVVVLRVSDTGAGMSPEVRSRVFEPFFTTKPTGEGTGLGMAVVHGIVTSHGARAEVTSIEAQGTTFEILFPRVGMESLFDEGLDPSMVDDLEPRVTPTESMPTPAASLLVVAGAAPNRATPDSSSGAIDGDGSDSADGVGGASIVVVDDEAGVAHVVAEALAQVGHTVQLFTHPEVALAAMRQAPQAMDLLITDHTMPGLTGDQLAEAVHAVRPDLPVLVLTGFRDRLSAERVAAAGIAQVLDKPVELAVLQAAVAEALAGAVSSPASDRLV